MLYTGLKMIHTLQIQPIILLEVELSDIYNSEGLYYMKDVKDVY